MIIMRKIVILIAVLFCACFVNAETIIGHYYGSEVDLTRKNNPCKGSTAGGVEVVVITDVQSIANNEKRTVVTRTFKQPDGKVLKKKMQVVDAPKAKVLHSLFPRVYPKRTA